MVHHHNHSCSCDEWLLSIWGTAVLSPVLEAMPVYIKLPAILFHLFSSHRDLLYPLISWNTFFLFLNSTHQKELQLFKILKSALFLSYSHPSTPIFPTCTATPIYEISKLKLQLECLSHWRAGFSLLMQIVDPWTTLELKVPPHQKSVYNFWLPPNFTKSLPLDRSLTNNMNTRLTHILYVVCIIYYFLTIK